MKLYFTYLSVFVLLLSCTKTQPISIVDIIENDDLASFQEQRHKLNLDTVNFFGGGTALHYALKYGSKKISKQLIEDNYKLNAVDSLGLTPLLIASYGSSDKLIDLLLEKSVDPNKIEDKNGFSALHYAVYRNNSDLVKKLIAGEADLNIKSKSDKSETPLHLALRKENIEIIKILLKATTITDTLMNANNETAKELGLFSNNMSIKNAFYNKLSKNEKEDLFIESVRNSVNVELLKKILEEEVLSQELINENFIFSNDTLISSLLLEHKVEVSYFNTKCDLGAIHRAAVRGDTIMLKFLIDKGANVNQLSSNGQISPLMHAVSLYEDLPIDTQNSCAELLQSIEKNENNSLGAVKLLLENKADLHFANLENENALYISESNSNKEVVNYLKSMGAIETKAFSELE